MAKDLITAVLLEEQALEWTTLRRGKGRPQVIDAGRVELSAAPGPAPEASEGTPPPLPPEATRAGAIKAACAGLKGDVTLGLPSSQLLLRVVDLPEVSPAELGSMVDLQVDKLSPFPVETMVVSHEVLARKDGTCQVLIAAVRTNVVDAMGDLLTPAGIAASRVDATVLGWWRLLVDDGQLAESGRHVILLMRDPIPEIIVIQDGTPILFRSLGDSQGLSEAETAAELELEVGQTLMSVELERGDAPIESFSIRGAGGAAEAMARNLQSTYGSQVALLGFDTLPPASEGLARRTLLQGAGSLDLVPDTWRKGKQSKTFKRRMLITVAALAGLWLLGAGLFVGGLAYERQRLAAFTAHAEEWQAPAQDVRDMRRRVIMITQHTDNTYSALECLREVSRLLPSGIDISSFSYRKSEGIKLSGEARAVDLVYQFKNRLDEGEFFPETVLRSVRHDRRKNKEIFNMEIRLPGEES